MENARNRQSRGIMQVNYGPWDLTANMTAGVKLLREYFEMLGSEKAAITAYNCGPSNYRKGKCRDVYYRKVQEKRKEYETWLQLRQLHSADGDWDRGGSGDQPGDIQDVGQAPGLVPEVGNLGDESLTKESAVE